MTEFLNGKIDDILVDVAKDIKDGGYDPAILPPKSTSFKMWPIKVTATLKDGKIEGLSDITRNGDTLHTGKNPMLVSGNLKIGQTKAYIAAFASGGPISVSGLTEATIDRVDIAYEIETCRGCPMTLTKLDIAVGQINVNIKGLGVLGKHLGKVTSLASNLIKGYIINTYKGVVATEIQNALDDHGALTIPGRS